jgi:hypothetical protein
MLSRLISWAFRNISVSRTASLGSAYPWGGPPVVDSRENPNRKRQYADNPTINKYVRCEDGWGPNVFHQS